MKLSDLKDVLYGKVDIYRDISGDGPGIKFEDVYKGSFQQMPEEYMRLKVGCIGGDSDGTVGIRVE